jgi:hypothetical protein
MAPESVGILRSARAVFREAIPDRALVFCPDAIGEHLLGASAESFSLVRSSAPIEIRLSASLPPKTPVCFASMFTGAPPSVHGIRKYERPVLNCDTVFDSLSRAGRRTAIVAVRGSSIDLIFRGRPLDYLPQSDDRMVTSAALDLLARDSHDLIVAYQQEYDDALHETGPFAPNALEAVKRHAADFKDLSLAAAESWSARDWFVLFAPDHGAHVLPDGSGDHGEDIPEDMWVRHYWGFRARKGEG